MMSNSPAIVAPSASSSAGWWRSFVKSSAALPVKHATAAAAYGYAFVETLSEFGVLGLDMVVAKQRWGLESARDG